MTASWSGMTISFAPVNPVMLSGAWKVNTAWGFRVTAQLPKSFWGAFTSGEIQSSFARTRWVKTTDPISATIINHAVGVLQKALRLPPRCCFRSQYVLTRLITSYSPYPDEHEAS